MRSRTMPPETKELLRQAIVQREKKLIALRDDSHHFVTGRVSLVL